MEIEKVDIKALSYLVGHINKDDVIEQLLEEVQRLTQIIKAFEHHIESINKIQSECKIK